MSIFFEAAPSEIETRKIIRIPLSSSQMLPSRGMVMIQGTMNGIAFQAPLEPDGKGSHWFEVSDVLIEETGIAADRPASFQIDPVDEWTEPEMPADIIEAIRKADLTNQWNAITVKARWEWLRWIRSTSNPATRQKRIDVACSKLQKGDKRPCCFDASRCTVPEVSKSGVLFD
ncbi:hypothetical protein HNQ56_003290 [Anaerotaenia torta]|uniref:YdeI/OmpD-associated family protein n=1 Tax=Anaerotaenia torta TaxID=433293 RepID=UPI003D24B544